MSKNLTRLFDLPEYQLHHTPQEKAFNTKIDGKWVVCIQQRFIQKNSISSTEHASHFNF